MQRSLVPAALAACLLGAVPTHAEPASPWVGEGSAKLRLVDAGKGPVPGERLAAISIMMSPGWKTYWRQPGANGVPPRFDFSGSTNVSEVKVAYPVPERLADEDGVTNVYHDEVTLPVTVTPRDPSAPVELKLVADYGVCERICVPAHGETELDIEPTSAGSGPAADDVRVAITKTPKAEALGAPGELAIGAVTRSKVKDGVALEVVATAPASAGQPVMFAETGDGDFVPAPEFAGATKDGKAKFRIVFEEPELPASGLKLTLAAGGKAIETAVALDAIKPTP